MELPSSPRIDGGIANEMRRRKLAQDRLKSVAISGLLGVVALGAMIWMGDQGEPGQGRSQGASSLSTSRSAALKRISIAHGQKLALTGLDGNSTDVQIGGEVAGGTSSNNTVGACTAIPAAIPVLSLLPSPFPHPLLPNQIHNEGLFALSRRGSCTSPRKRAGNFRCMHDKSAFSTPCLPVHFLPFSLALAPCFPEPLSPPSSSSPLPTY